ncbi:MAG: DUF488 domain-containing protein [Thermodesulfovibrionia bacterium]
MSLSVFTAGYESRDINEFIGQLQEHNIQTVVDVREIPASRKQGFSKKRLIEHLDSANIKYIHIKELGSPKSLRHKLYKDKDYNYFFKKYKKYLSTQLDTLRSLYNEVIINEVSCLICFEKNASQCHRTIVAEKIKEIDRNGLRVNHI